MADISTSVDPIVGSIYEAYEKRHGQEPPRTYLGSSIIGKECARAIWYDFRWASPVQFDGRMYRLFQTGHLEEPRLVEDLRSIGATVWEVDPANGQQFGVSSHGGHMRGHCDGVAKNIPGGGAKPHLLEFKTHSAKSFAELVKKGVEKAKPQHFAQMQDYMGKLDLERALYMAKNKDTDELYSERLKADKVEFLKIQEKADRIIFSDDPPPKISDDPKFFLCNWCDHNAVCHGGRVPQVSCRTCVHATPEREGDARWSCKLAGPESEIPVEVQRTGCPDHLPLPHLVTYATPQDAGENWVMFKRKDNGRTFIVTTGKVPFAPQEHPMYSTHEISAAKDHRCIADPGVEQIRTQFPGATITG